MNMDKRSSIGIVESPLPRLQQWFVILDTPVIDAAYGPWKAKETLL
jgi:hypothetical protein